MRRREFVRLLGGAIGSLPLAATAQQGGPPLRRIGIIVNTGGMGGYVDCLLRRLRELGWNDGSNVQIDLRWGEGLTERYAAFAAEFARTKPDLIVVTSTPATIEVQRATTTIPVVFISVSDPVKSGIVASIARPGGNLTGVSNSLPATTTKLLEFLKLVAPNSKRVGVLHNPNNQGKLLEMEELRTAAQMLTVDLEPVEVRASRDFSGAFAKIEQFRCEALVVLQDGLIFANRQSITEFAGRARLPAIYQIREFVEIGGLMSYGLNFCDHYVRAASYVDRILKGSRPADLPIEMPTRFELVVNLKAARASGVDIAASLIARADSVIE